MTPDDDYLYGARGTVDPEVERLEALLGRYAHRGTRPLRPMRVLPRQRRSRWPAAIAAMLLLGLGGLYTWSQYRLHWPEHRPWAVASQTGEVRIDGRPLAEGATLAPGAELRTGVDGAVLVDVARIGRLALGPDARIRLDATGAGRHRVEWLGGRLWARVWAPPGQFGVGIAGVEALDLGCEFVVDGAAGGDARLTVRSGWVQIGAGDVDVLVPEGATVALPRGAAPGTPHALDASAGFVAALRSIDARDGNVAPDGDEVRALVAMARPRDAISLVSLLQRHPSLARGVLFEATHALLPEAGPVSREAVLSRASNALEPWWRALPYPRMKRWWLHWRDALPAAAPAGEMSGAAERAGPSPVP